MPSITSAHQPLSDRNRSDTPTLLLAASTATWLDKAVEMLSMAAVRNILPLNRLGYLLDPPLLDLFIVRILGSSRRCIVSRKSAALIIDYGLQ